MLRVDRAADAFLRARGSRIDCPGTTFRAPQVDSPAPPSPQAAPGAGASPGLSRPLS